MKYLRAVRLLPAAIVLLCTAVPAQAQLSSRFDKTRVWLRSAEPVVSTLYELNKTMLKADMFFGQYMSEEITEDSFLWYLDSLEQDAKMIIELTRTSASYIDAPPQSGTSSGALRLPDVYVDLNATIDSVSAINSALFTAYRAGIGGDTDALDQVEPLSLDQKDILLEILEASLYSEILMYSNEPHPQAELIKLMGNGLESTLLLLRIRLAVFLSEDAEDTAVRLDQLRTIISDMEKGLVTAKAYQSERVASLEKAEPLVASYEKDSLQRQLDSFRSYDDAWPVEQKIIDQLILTRDGILSGSLDDFEMLKAIDTVRELNLERSELMRDRNVYYIP